MQWALTTFDWFSGGGTSGVVNTPPLFVAGIAIGSPLRRYLFSLGVVAVLTFIAARLVSGRMGREFLRPR